jgi:hypothetical protein
VKGWGFSQLGLGLKQFLGKDPAGTSKVLIAKGSEKVPIVRLVVAGLGIIGIDAPRIGIVLGCLSHDQPQTPQVAVIAVVK